MNLTEELKKKLIKLPTGNIADNNNQTPNQGVMDTAIKPVDSKMKMIGRAFTAQCFPGDNLALHQAIYAAKPGDVLILDVHGYSNAGHFGDIMATACKEYGLAGVVIDGSCRDSEDIKELGFPVFVRAFNPSGTVKESLAKMNIPVHCGGIVVNPGDIVFGDCDGVVVIPQEHEDAVFKKALDKFHHEQEIIEQLKAGKTTLEIYHFDKIIEAKKEKLLGFDLTMNKDFTKGNISAYLVSLAAPLMVGNILQEFYNTIDAFVVGRFAGKEEFAAIGIAGTAMNLFLFALVGCCNGFSILFAQAYGNKNMSELRKQHFSALIAGMGCAIFLMMIGLTCMKPLLTLLQTPTELHGYVASYLFWIFLSLPAVFFYNLFASLLRASGDTKASLFVLIASVVINLLMDVVLVGTCQMGIEGAAIATAVTQIISAILCFAYLWKTHREMVLHRKDCSSSHKDILKSLKTGLITSLHQSSLYLGKLLVQGTVNTGGTDVIAAYTAATRIEGFANSIGSSGSVSTSILTAQNYGAGKNDRVQKTFRCSLGWLAKTGLFAAIVMFLFAPQTIALMLGNTSGTSYEEGIRYLRLVSVFYLFCYTGNTFTGYYNGIGKVIMPFIGATGHILIRVVLSSLLFPVMGLNSVALATGIGWVIANCFWGIAYRYLNKGLHFTEQ